MRRPAPTRTGLLLGVLLAVTGCGGTAEDGTTAQPPSTQPSPAPASSAASSSAPPASCADRTLADLSLDEQVGQLLMVGVPAADPASGTAALAGVPVGGLFLQGRSSADAASVAASVAELQEGAAVPLQIAVDQEGGLVQTLKGPGFDRVPTALEQGRQDPAALRSATAGWAGQLHAAGITMDLGPSRTPCRPARRRTTRRSAPSTASSAATRRSWRRR